MRKTDEPKPADEAVEEKEVAITEDADTSTTTNQGDAVETLAAEDVKTILAASKLPKASQNRMSERTFETREQLSEAITAEIEYIKEISGSGKPFGMSESESTAPKPVNMAEVEKRKDEVNQKHFRS